MSGLLGLMMGAASVSWNDTYSFLPGAMADHLTSLAGAFDHPAQTKMTDWIRAGATATAGTVAEPYSLWAKFPSARFFVHYAAGCTMLESFYQSLRCPLQILLLGDPLAAPYADRAELRLTGWPVSPASGVFRLRAEVTDSSGAFFHDFLFLLDGKLVSTGSFCDLDSERLAAGQHRLRCIARSTGLVRHQVSVEKVFTAGE